MEFELLLFWLLLYNYASNANSSNNNMLTMIFKYNFVCSKFFPTTGIVYYLFKHVLSLALHGVITNLLNQIALFLIVF